MTVKKPFAARPGALWLAFTYIEDFDVWLDGSGESTNVPCSLARDISLYVAAYIVVFAMNFMHCKVVTSFAISQKTGVIGQYCMKVLYLPG